MPSDVPTLILSGALDPITPPEWSTSAARSLTRSTLVARPGAGHLDEDDCSLRLIAEFIARATAEGMDVSCARRSRREEFGVK